MARPETTRKDYAHIAPLQTRWSDNDVYGHLNNVVYYSLFDTLVNDWLIAHGGLDIHNGDVIGLVVETGCRYFAPLAFPQELEGGLSIARIGSSSVRYETAIFVAGADAPAAEGRFIHVYVDRATRRPTPLPPAMRRAMEALARDPG